MSELKLRPRTELVLDGHPYRVSPHPRIPMMAFAQEGGAGTVYRVEDPQGSYKALKVFHPSHRAPALVQTAEALRPWSAIPGLEVCDFRVLHTQNHRPLLQQFPQLTYAMVMPWIEGPAWQEIVLDEARALTPDQSLEFAAALADSLAQLEQRGVAHCDLSGGNLLLPALREGYSGHPIALVDIEQMHCPGRLRPDPCGAGSKGYRHLMSSAITYWSPKADRFAGAVLLAEVLGWCDPDVRAARAGETFFASDLPQNDMAQLEVLRKALERLWGSAVARLLTRAFETERLDDCPVFDEWRLALNHPGKQKSSARAVASGPRIPITEVVERIRKLEERGQYREALQYGLSMKDEPGLPEGFRLELPLILEDLQAKMDGGGAAPARPSAPVRPQPEARPRPEPARPVPPPPVEDPWASAPPSADPSSAWAERPSARSSWGATAPLDDDIWESAMPAGAEGQEHEASFAPASAEDPWPVAPPARAPAPPVRAGAPPARAAGPPARPVPPPVSDEDPWASAPPAPVAEDPWASAPPAPVEEDPWASAPPMPVEEDPWASAPPMPVEEDPWASAPPMPVEEDPWASAPPMPAEEDPWASAPPVAVEEDPWAAAPPVAVEEDPWASAPPMAVEEDPWASAPPVAVEEDPWASAPPVAVEEDPWASASPVAVEEPLASPPPRTAALLSPVPESPSFRPADVFPASPGEAEAQAFAEDELFSGPPPEPVPDQEPWGAPVAVENRVSWSAPTEGEVFAFPVAAETPAPQAPTAYGEPPRAPLVPPEEPAPLEPELAAPPPADYVPPFLLAFEFTNADPVTGQFGLLHDYGGDVTPDVVWIEVNGRKYGIEEAEQGQSMPSLTAGLNLLRFVMRGNKRSPIKEFRCEIVYDLPKVEGVPTAEESPGERFCLSVDDGRSRQTFPLDAERTVVGRSTDCDIVLIDASLTRRFRLVVERRGSKYFLVRENPAFEVRLNGEALEADEVELSPEDTMALGNRTRIRFLPAESDSAAAGAGGPDAVRSKA